MGELNIIIKNFTDCFSNRELAIITWCLAVFFFILCNKDIRKSILLTLKYFYGYKLVLLRIILYGFIGGITIALYKLHILSQLSTIKDVIIYSMFSALPLLYDSIQNSDTIKHAISRNVRATTIIAIYLNLFSFSYIIEMFLLPLVFLIGLISEGAKFKDKMKYKYLIGFLNIVIVIIALTGIVYTIYMTTTTPKIITITLLAKGVLLPLLLTITIIPYTYTIALISKYQLIFVRINQRESYEKMKTCCQYNNHYSQWKKTIVKTCTISISRLEYISKDLKIFMYETDEKFFDELAQLNNEYAQQQVIIS